MRKLYLFQVAYATDGKKKRTLFSLFEQIGRTTAVLIKSTRLVKMKKKKKVSIDAQEENRNQNYP